MQKRTRIISKHEQSKRDALEILARQRRGEKIEQAPLLDEPLFEEVNPEDYKRTRRSGFIEDEDSDSDIDFIDDGDDDDDRQHHEKKEWRKSKSTNVERTSDSRQRSVKSYFGDKKAISKTGGSSSLTMPNIKKESNVDQDEILSQMLLDVPVNRLSTQKAVKVQQKVAPSANSKPLKTKAHYEPISVKRQRVSSPNYQQDDLSANDFQDDCFDDSLGAFPEPPVDVKPSDFNIKSEISCEIEAMDDVGISAVPLDDDLKSNLEFFELHDGQQYTRMYWYDCVEDQTKSPGVVYFFGRIFIKAVKRYVSCCTIVKNIRKTCYLLIKSDSTYEQAVGEFTQITAKLHKIKNFTCQQVSKKYAFSSDSSVPLEADYIQVDYVASQVIPADLTGETFSQVLNVNQSPMEKMILNLKLRGPCWLRVIDPVAPSSQISWSRIELVIENPSHLVVDESPDKLSPPYFCVFSLCLRTYPNPVTHKNEIVSIAGMVNTAFNLDQCLKRNNKASGHFVLMTKPPPAHKELKLPFDFQVASKKYQKTIFELFDSERDLLQAFMDRFSNLDPDIVVGHDILNFDFETLVMRMNTMKVGVWSKLGRFRRTELPSTKAAFRYMFSGRVICDIKSSAMELIRARSYDLTELSSQLLNKKRREYDHTSVVESFKSSETLIEMIHQTWEDNDSIFSILVELNVIPLALKITNITGNILSRTLAAGRSERNEYLLLHAFHEANFICPEKQITKFHKRFPSKSGVEPEESTQLRKKAAYTGGLVLEPKTGYYDTCILLMDFNSLYPSIIQEYNICFSTVKSPKSDPSNPNAELIANVPNDNVATGILPAQLKSLVDRRRCVKRELSDCSSQSQKLLLDIEQKALKLTANSMYGCLGFEQSRFYAKHLASLVTYKGREILLSTKAMVEQLGYEVIYGDTDSLMINTKIIDYDEVIQRGNSIKSEINRTFKLLEIDIDGVYRPLLLLKKKNYAGATIKKLGDGKFSKDIETKGIDTVRRDRAVIAKEAGEKVLDMILNGDKEIDQIVEDIHNYLKDLGSSIAKGQLSNEKFLISKQLNRNPEEYRDTKGVGHVSLALRHNNDSRSTKKLRSGDTVEYVICCDGTSESANQRAYTLQEMATNENLKLDYEYYLCQQIHPVMTRICEKLPTTNAYVLAEMLGVEKSNLLHLRSEQSGESKLDQLLSRGEARFNTCQPLTIKCPNCNLPDEIRTRSRRGKDKKLEFSMTNCPQCGIRYAMRPQEIVVQLINLVRKMTLDLYNSKFVCENAECAHETRNLFRILSNDSTETRAQPLCDKCDSVMIAEMNDRKMDLQLNYFRYLLSIDRVLSPEESAIIASEDCLFLYRQCLQEVSYALKCSFINNIDTQFVFSMVCSASKAA